MPKAAEDSIDVGSDKMVSHSLLDPGLWCRISRLLRVHLPATVRWGTVVNSQPDHAGCALDRHQWGYDRRGHPRVDLPTRWLTIGPFGSIIET